MDDIEKFDIVVIGGGPAGLSAAINAKIRNKEVAIFENQQLGGKIWDAPHVDNYLGFYDIDGQELVNKFIDHINKLEIPVIKKKVIRTLSMGEYFSITTNQENYEADKIILATGVNNPNRIDGETEFLGQGVSYCATCDGKLFRGKKVAVLGYAEDSVEETNYLAELAETTYFIPEDDLDYEELASEVEIIESEPEEIKGDGFVDELVLEDRSLEVAGVMILRPTVPTDEIIDGLDLEDNYIKVDSNFETSVEGVYAAGDCVGKPLQLPKAVGEGQVAILNAVE
ncbi:NAD(P)/FAD-dependent oxidoreductase [Acetohalobium arabaticum]|uniref:FAD-dependent pyridine nucleotide-disulfide oxidoreductase n=1 Tax=Acetohalobium arabaticum (strain ATCC 49924 / DSM 5501 / Z-7288) TaxID=574087 RepID=D9QS01_ACEAZ|nr:NAD(P)/FAD-dependent oxidoreductase [Acetohalobium arabaticum]ADL13292.1 FAD-dependent pyridine nucleotide-disulfide oxidoreductase [Acetohalobium arabaticum DSM 5501]